MPNLLLIAGNGRNVGKTYLARQIIRFFSDKNEEVIGIKISPHFHPFSKKSVLIENNNYVIIGEKQNNSKDSSLFLQAGAKQVFFIMAKQENIPEAFEKIQEHLRNKLVVCESGGLRDWIKPGLFLFVNRSGQEITKISQLKYNPVHVNNFGNQFDFDINKLHFFEGKISLEQ